ncbi:MAG: methylglyoxal synthase, partial [Eubacteriaceae bacterium]|nr:methylglyoxal synthase [Eubacteriaceae bacterium]
SGPLGGDQEIGALISDNKIDIMIFFWDPLTTQPHDPDVKALLRIAVLYDVPVAMNKTSANYLLKSALMNSEYERNILHF